MKEFVEKLIGRLEEKIDIIKDEVYRDYEERIIEECAIGNVIDIVNELAEEYNNGWISVSERLPEIGKWVLGQGVYDMMLVCYTKSYRGDFDWMDINGDLRAISAWQPLPAPFKKGSE